MTSPAIDQIQAALGRVNDPEIKRPITDLGMVEKIDVDDTGLVTVTRAPDRGRMPDEGHHHPGRHRGGHEGLRRDRRQRRARRDDRRTALQPPGHPARRPGPAGDPVRPARVADQGARDRLRQGRRRQVLGHREPRRLDGRPGPQGRDRRRRHLRPLGPGDARHRGHPAHPGRGPDHAGADRERRLGDQHRDAQAASRPGRRLAWPDARPGPRADALRRLLGRPRRAPARPPARHGRRGHLAGPAPAERRGPRGDHAAGRRRPRWPSAPARWPR